MKVLFFIRSMMVGGTQRQLVAMASGLSKRGHDVSVAVFYRSEANEAELERAGVRIVDLQKAGRWQIFAPLVKLRRIIKTERPDIVYSFLPTPNVLTAMLVPADNATRLVFGIRSAGTPIGAYDVLSTLSFRFEAWLSRRADFIISNSHAGEVEGIARGMPPDRIAVVANGIDVNAMHPDPIAGRAFRRMWNIPEDSFVIGLVARLDPMKDYETFLDAAAAFMRDYPRSVFVCIGEGPQSYRVILARHGQLLGLTDRIRWIPDCRDMCAAYNAFDIATLSSVSEGFPNVVAEAMACGTPVAATDCGDVSLIVNGHGEIVPPRRADLLSASWAKLCARLSREPQIGEAARNSIVSMYGINTMVDKTERILMALAKGQSSAAIMQEFSRSSVT